MMYMNRTQIYLDPDQQTTLRAIASERATTISELIREAVREIIGRYRKPKADPLQGIVGLYRDESDRTGAIHHDDLYE